MRRRQDTRAERDLLAGTLDMLILRMLQGGAAHGLQIAQDIERRSDDVLLVEQGSLLSRAPPPGEAGMDFLVMGCLRYQPAGALL